MTTQTPTPLDDLKREIEDKAVVIDEQGIEEPYMVEYEGNKCYCQGANKEFNVFVPILDVENIIDKFTSSIQAFLTELKKEVDRQADEVRNKQEMTNNNEVALERLERANLIYGNNGVLEIIDKTASKHFGSLVGDKK